MWQKHLRFVRDFVRAKWPRRGRYPCKPAQRTGLSQIAAFYPRLEVFGKHRGRHLARAAATIFCRSPYQRLTGFVVVAGILAMILSACSGDPTPTQVPPVESTPAEAVTAQATSQPGAAGGGEKIGGTVSVLAVWGGDELESFRAMVAPFEEQTGIQVAYEGTRDLNAVLTTRIEGGNPPDLAGLPGPGQLLELARAGRLIALNDVLDMQAMQAAYDEGFLELATVDGKLYGIFTKAAVKSLVWYNPKSFAAAGYAVPTTWEELDVLEAQVIADGAQPWCIGLESGAASGWPGTDWVEDILLHRAGPQVYDRWWKHEIAWTDAAVQDAWQAWGEIVNDPAMVYGGTPYVLSTNFGEAAFPLFDTPPKCYLHHQANFITGFIAEQFPTLLPGEDYDFFPFPATEPANAQTLLVAGDLFGMFNDTPQARALMQYLVKAEAQSIWAGRGGFLSANKMVDAAVYPDELTRKIGEMLAQADAVRFDASDLMPEAVNNAFLSAVMDFASGSAAPEAILQTLETTASEVDTQE